jgi:hypothetical protein
VRTFAIAFAVMVAAACGGDDDGTSDGSTSDGGTSVIDGAPGGADAQVAAGCEEYCASILASCTTTLAQYRDQATCLASCALFPPGEPGADSGDSLACRVTHAALAVDEPDPHCRHAGPSGGGVCGAPCDAYCDIVMGVCELYGDDGACMDTCAGFPEVGMYSTRQSRGDSVECRIFHATLATEDPQSHCGTAGPDSTPCSDL